MKTEVVEIWVVGSGVKIRERYFAKKILYALQIQYLKYICEADE